MNRFADIERRLAAAAPAMSATSSAADPIGTATAIAVFAGHSLVDIRWLLQEIRRMEGEIDRAWEGVNSLGSPDTAERPTDEFAFGFSRGVNHAVEQSLKIIELNGGKDPLVRRAEGKP